MEDLMHLEEINRAPARPAKIEERGNGDRIVALQRLMDDGLMNGDGLVFILYERSPYGRCGMGETRKESKKSVSSNAGQAISRRILVADDNNATKDIVSSFLDFMGFEVALAGNGVEALSLFLENSFDLVLTDLEMPIMDGWSLTHCIKERSPNTPVVLMTGANRETVLKKVERVPVDSVIFKPFGLEDLQRTVQGALR